MITKIVSETERSTTVQATTELTKVKFNDAWNYYAIRNDGSSEAYVSKRAFSNTTEDGVISIPAQGVASIPASVKSIYITGSGSVLVLGQNTPSLPFKVQGKGGDTEYGENIFDFNAFKTKLSALPQPVANGNITWLDNGFTLTASSADCYTWFGEGTAPYFEVEKNTAYEISCDVSGDTGHIYIFFDYPPVGEPFIYYKNTNTKFTFTTLSSTQKITLRFGVQGMGNSCTYSNIKIRKIL